MTISCPGCRFENSPKARFCARCGSPLEVPDGAEAGIQKALHDAAQSVDDLIKSPSVQEITRKVGDVVQQAGDEIERVVKSDGAQRTFQQIGHVAGQAVKAIKDPLLGAKTSQSPSVSQPATLSQPPCLRCGAANRRDGRFCAACGASLDLAPIALHYVIAQQSDLGQVRSNNEDTARMWSFVAQGLPAWALLVADGMGGAASGEVASQRVAEVVEQEIAARAKATAPKATDLERWLRVILRGANSAVYRQAQADSALHGMGSTATLAWLEGDRATIAHVGDSRAYLIPPAGPFWQITQDHTMVALLAAIGEMTDEEAAASPQNNLLYKAIGVAPKVEIDTYVRRLEAGDRLLLCSDGLIRHVPAGEMAAVVRQHADPAVACQTLVALANQRGGEDNISVIVAQAQAAPTDIGA